MTRADVGRTRDMTDGAIQTTKTYMYDSSRKNADTVITLALSFYFV